MNFRDKVYIVTGSGTGVGAATALALARDGARLVINYTKSESEAHDIIAKCRAVGAQAIVQQGDVAEDAACLALARAAQDKWGRIDGLVNNAGTTKFTSRRLDAIDAQEFHRVFAVNTIGAFQMVRACESALRASKGAVVNVSSTASIEGTGSSYAYTASKGALNALTLQLARNLAPDIRVNAVLPGFIETRWLMQGLGENYENARINYRARTALAETLTPDDVADAVVYLLGANKTTGELMRLDCGAKFGGRR